MFLRELTASIESLKGVGSKTAAKLAQAGLSSIAALLSHYPRDWEDRSRLVPLKDWAGGTVCTTVKVLAHDWFGYGAMRTLKIHVEDESMRAALVCFNRPFLQRQLAVGGRYRLWGKFYYKFGELQSTAFEVEAAEGSESGGVLSKGPSPAGIVPVYPLSAGIGQNLLRRLAWEAAALYAPKLNDELPAPVMAAQKLLSKAEAVRAIHFPSSMEERDRARQTLIFEELFYLELGVGRRAFARRRGSAASVKANPAPPLSPLQGRLLGRMPFKLTPGQEEAVAEINASMEEGPPMARLLQGDVGSGKTLVAFFAALKAVDSEGGQAAQPGQVAIMAPTELLARQHAENAARLLEPLGIRPAFLTGNLKAAGRTRLLEALAAGEIDIVLGTHALFSKDVVYRNLRLVVVDEQHRFGVTQRQAIVAKGQNSLLQKGPPHLLMMSATPIPRTLALTVYGDLDVSTIRDMPPGRKPVKTHLARESNAGKVYDFVRKELALGRQAYFVYPLIGDDEGADEDEAESGLKNAVAMADELSKKIFPGFPAALVHSRLDDDQKRAVMEAFRRGDVRILAATTVVEVGVDVPNASCMVVHHAERFGLAALHQLRGRVGRGRDQGYCFLIYSDQEEAAGGRDPETLSEEERSREGKRLMVMLENTDGFVIAEKDLAFRGPGQIAGVEQSGYFRLGIADPVRDSAALLEARGEAFALLEKDPGLTLPENHCVAEVLALAPLFSESSV